MHRPEQCNLPEFGLELINKSKLVRAGWRQQFNANEELLTLIREQFDNMLSQGIIKQVPDNVVANADQFNMQVHRVVVVQKLIIDPHSKATRRKVRITLDLRQLNENTVRMKAQMPLIEQFAEVFIGCRIFTDLDFPDYFYQFPLSKEAEYSLCFRAPDGNLMALTKSPMGASNTPGFVQEFLNVRILAAVEESLRAETRRAGRAALQHAIDGYIDNMTCATRGIIVNGKYPLYPPDSPEEAQLVEAHLQLLETIFSKCLQVGLRLPDEFKKCAFLMTKSVTLGIVFDGKETRVDETRVRALLELNVPAKPDIQFLRTAVAQFGYYRRFCRSTAYLTSLNLLNQLRVRCEQQHIYVQDQWDVDPVTKQKSTIHTAAYNLLKHELINSSARGIVDYRKPVYLYTDASLLAWGALLTQVNDDGFEVPIYIFGKQFTEPQTRASTQLREAYAVRAAVQKLGLKSLLMDIIWRTDNSNNLSMYDSTDPKIRAIYLEIQHVIRKAQHIKGEANVFADALSRHKSIIESGPAEVINTVTIVDGPETVVRSTSLYRSIRDIPFFRDLAAAQAQYVYGNASFPAATMKRLQSVVIPDQDGHAGFTLALLEGNPYIPKEATDIAKQVLFMSHDLRCHIGYNETLNGLVRVHLANATKFAKDYIASCIRCQHTKTPTHPPKVGTIDPMIVSYPLQLVQVDFKGPVDPTQTATPDTIKYLLTISDLHSRFTLFIPTAKDDAEAAINGITQLINLCGLPTAVQTDHGTHFGSRFQLFLEKNGIQHLTSKTPYRPETMGVAERSHLSITTLLKPLLSPEKLARWYDYVGEAQRTHNQRITSTTGVSPHKAFFGWEATSPLQAHLQLHDENYVPEAREGTRRLVEFNSAVSALREILAHGKLTTPNPNIKPGDFVLVYYPTKVHKLKSYYRGPYVVISQDPNPNYYVVAYPLLGFTSINEKDKYEDETKVHISRLIKYNMDRSSILEEIKYEEGYDHDAIEEIVGHTFANGQYTFSVRWNSGGISPANLSDLLKMKVFTQYIHLHKLDRKQLDAQRRDEEKSISQDFATPLIHTDNSATTSSTSTTLLPNSSGQASPSQTNTANSDTNTEPSTPQTITVENDVEDSLPLELSKKRKRNNPNGEILIYGLPLYLKKGELNPALRDLPPPEARLFKIGQSVDYITGNFSGTIVELLTPSYAQWRYKVDIGTSIETKFENTLTGTVTNGPRRSKPNGKFTVGYVKSITTSSTSTR
jgi:hypothetical protein